MIRSGKPSEFDYGPYKNLEVYGQTLPPVYPLEKLTTTLSSVPVILIVGDRDVLVPKHNL